ncbi:MAG TPA: ABC transporter permease [Vicinamibacteria bacterium]|nr:ABC transporter permease [Vicinamibacteria bacterium]
MSIATGMVYDLPLAAGATLVLLVGGIDLSLGAVLALSGVVTALAMRAGWPIPLAVAAGLFLSAGVGALNGLLVTRFRLAPFIVTLGTMSLARGAAVVLTSGYMVAGLPPAFLTLGRGHWLGVPVSIWIVAVLLAGSHLLLRRWQPLHDAFYVGQNREAARLSGVRSDLLTATAYVVSAVLAGIAALFMVSRLGMGYARFGELAELRAIAAAVLGGAAFSGGAGSILGSALGVLLLAVILNGFVLLNLSIHWQNVAVGVVLVLAIALDAARRRFGTGGRE